jgi:hypothetical protein
VAISNLQGQSVSQDTQAQARTELGGSAVVIQRLLDTGAITGPYRRTRPITRASYYKNLIARVLRAIFERKK